MADMVTADGKKMTIGISVDGSDIAAYACNGDRRRGVVLR